MLLPTARYQQNKPSKNIQVVYEAFCKGSEFQFLSESTLSGDLWFSVAAAFPTVSPEVMDPGMTRLTSSIRAQHFNTPLIHQHVRMININKKQKLKNV